MNHDDHATDGRREALDDPMYDEQNPVIQFARAWIERNGGEITRQLTMLLRDMDGAFVSRDQFALSIENRNQRIDALESDRANLLRRVTDHEAREKAAADAVRFAADAINADQNLARIVALREDNYRLARRACDLEQELGNVRAGLAYAREELGERQITKRRERRRQLEKLGSR